jgi:hypothetical protein
MQILRQSGFPSPAQLLELRREGVRHLINVSGIDLLAVYGKDLTDGLDVESYLFKDIFSRGKLIGQNFPGATIPDNLYVRQTSTSEREAFYQSVMALISHLKYGQPAFVFCHEGVGRSPCVIAAALGYCYGIDFPALVRILKYFNSRAVFTDVSYSAVRWCLAELAEQTNDAEFAWAH